jgi:peptidoglycan/LPS O-acetylase OafA/YrhL
MNDRQTAAARFATIDVLRGLAALFVACLHIRETAWIGERQFWSTHPSWLSLDALLAVLSAPVMFGSFGVSAFFVISGYCIHRAHATRLSRDASYRVDSGRFWFRRFVRIYPVLIAALLLTLLFDSISGHLVPGFYKLGDLSPVSLLINLSALEGLFSQPYGSNGPLWTLAIEIQLYAVYPLVFMLRRRFGINRTMLLALALTALSWLLFERKGLSLFASYQFAWMLGAYVADRETAASRTPAGRIAGWGGALVILGGCAVFVAVSQYLAFQIWAVGFAMVLARLLERPLHIGPVAAGFRQLGHFSYSLYAIHLPLAVLAVCALFGGTKQVSLIPAVLILAGAVACAFVFYQVFERPFIALLASRSESPVREPVKKEMPAEIPAAAPGD